MHDLDRNENHANDGRNQRSPVTQLIRRVSVDLTSHNTSDISDSLRNTERRCALIVRRRIVDNPCFVETWTAVQGEGDEVDSEVLDARVFDGKQDSVSDDREYVEDK